MSRQAKESPQVMKAREKLKKRLQVEHRRFTTQALEEMTKRIRSAIVRHHPESSFLKKKKISLFDENIHSAKIKSRHILKLQGMLQSTHLL